MEEENKLAGTKQNVAVLLVSILAISACGILYELLVSTLSSYFLGSSILHFSITIGVFLSAMGLGAFLSRFIFNKLLDWFISIEIWLALLGGLSALLLHAAFTVTYNYYLITITHIVILGTLIGLEIPLLTRILKKYKNLRHTIANVLSFDYLGALVASLVFPLLLLPYLGVMKTSFVVGMLNLAVAVLTLWFFRKEVQNPVKKTIFSGVMAVGLVVGFVQAINITGFFEKMVYQDEIIYTRQTPYQKLVLTKWNNDLRLFLNGNLQFSSVDEYRYHEPLVHIPMNATSIPAKHILLLGAGDGLAAKELLKYHTVETITIVDLDSAVTNICSTHPLITALNGNALNHPKIKIINADAFNFIKTNSQKFDVIIIDLPDPHETSLSKLYSKEFYGMLKQSLAVQGAMITQSTSPFFAKLPFWCIHNTLKQVFPAVYALQVYVPSFGQWGFQLALNYPGETMPDTMLTLLETHLKRRPAEDFRFLTEKNIRPLFEFDKDLSWQPTEINTLDNHALLHYYEKSWDNFNQ